MEQYIMKGGNPLVGEVTISGAKNAALGILTAAVMTDDDVVVENLVKKLLYQKERITALVMFNDQIAVASYKAAQELGVMIGRDLSIVGFDDDRVGRFVTPPLTTIWQPSYEKGEKALNILIDALEEERLPDAREELKGVMIYRHSCSAAPECS